MRGAPACGTGALCAHARSPRAALASAKRPRRRRRPGDRVVGRASRRRSGRGAGGWGASRAEVPRHRRRRRRGARGGGCAVGQGDQGRAQAFRRGLRGEEGPDRGTTRGVLLPDGARASPRPTNPVDANPARRLFYPALFPIIHSFIHSRATRSLVFCPSPRQPRPPGRTSSPRCERGR